MKISTSRFFSHSNVMIYRKQTTWNCTMKQYDQLLLNWMVPGHICYPVQQMESNLKSNCYGCCFCCCLYLQQIILAHERNYFNLSLVTTAAVVIKIFKILLVQKNFLKTSQRGRCSRISHWWKIRWYSLLQWNGWPMERFHLSNSTMLFWIWCTVVSKKVRILLLNLFYKFMNFLKAIKGYNDVTLLCRKYWETEMIVFLI